MDVRALAGAQGDVVAGWQLRNLGWTRRMVDDHARRRGWRVVHLGVYALTQAPLTQRQRWIAATLSAPATYLSHASAGACWGFRPLDAQFETVTRAGSGGRRRIGDLLVHRSRTLDGDVTTKDGIVITTPERTLIDLAAHLDDRAAGKATREALRLRATTTPTLLTALKRHQGRRGTAILRELAQRYAHLPLHRARSDAESYALELLAGDTPRVNHRIAGEEADLVWPDRRLVIEIDGPQYHQFPDEDARKERAWRKAGYDVRRISSDEVFRR